MDIAGLIGLSLVVFVSTNIDDIFVLMMFFADPHYTTRQIILGQYLGIGLLVGISTLGALAALVIPPSLIGLMGFFPIVIGLKQLFDLRETLTCGEEEAAPQSQHSAFQFLAIASVTFSNGGDNIGVYVPLFANSAPAEILLFVVVFMMMIVVWCGIAFYLVKHSAMKHHIQRIGRFLLPFVLIGLGVYILVEAFL